MEGKTTQGQKVGHPGKTIFMFIRTKNPLKFENDLKWPTFRGTEDFKLFTGKGARSVLET